jgi:TadE-like protein
MKSSKQRGAVLIEAAITVLVFFTFVLAILEFGRAYNIYHVLTNAAREGARFGVAPCPDESGTGECSAGDLPSPSYIQSRVCDFLGSGALSCERGQALVSVDQTFSGSVNGIAVQETQVTVTAPYSFLFFPFGQLNLTTQAVMRNENE